MAQHVMEHIINPMQKRWTCPKGRDAQALVEDIIEDCKGFSSDILQAAFQKVRKAHRYASWPPAIDFEAAAAAIEREGQKPVENPEVELEEPFEVRKQRLEEAMHSDQGQQALREGWGWDYFLHVKNGGDTVLAPREVQKFQRARVKTDQHLGSLVSHPDRFAGLHNALAELGLTIRRQEDVLRKRYLRETSGQQRHIQGIHND